jgi:propanol-preferring alcohol dehydrogenase
MRAMRLHRIASMTDEPAPLRLDDIPVPSPAPGEVLVEISACGVCHTELDEIEGRTSPPRLPVVPGHEVVGRVVELGRECSQLTVGTRVGVGWIYRSDGSELENLSTAFTATGRDADGGYAEYMTVPERYAYPLPDAFEDTAAAPLLCAGGVGFRALRLAGLRDGDILGLTGFGGSAHLVLQFARHLYPASPVYVFARDPGARDFALELGADWAGDTPDTPPEPCHAIIDTTPAWRPVLAALEALAPAGRLVINAIRKEDTDIGQLSTLSYERQLWLEKEIKTVANATAADIRAALEVAAAAGIRIETETLPLEQANEALAALRAGGGRGAKVLQILPD